MRAPGEARREGLARVEVVDMFPGARGGRGVVPAHPVTGRPLAPAR